jgi:hypothetical protein
MMIIDKSRRFGIISKNKKLVAEGMKLFEADFERQSYTTRCCGSSPSASGLQRAFIGSQSLRRLELENRREVGVIVTDGSVVRQLQQFFQLEV